MENRSPLKIMSYDTNKNCIYKQKTHKTIVLEEKITDSVLLDLIVFDQTHEKILIEKRFVFGINEYVYCSVSGEIHPDESINEAAQRLLEERTGLFLTNVIHILSNGMSLSNQQRIVTCVCEAVGLIKDKSSYLQSHADWYSKNSIKELLYQTETKISNCVQNTVYLWGCF